MYQPQIPFQMPAPWPTAVHRPVGPVVYNNNNNGHVESRRGSKHRAHSVDTDNHSHPPVGYYNQQQQQQPAATVTEHHHHRHHHHRAYPTNTQVNGTGPSEETAKEQNVLLVKAIHSLQIHNFHCFRKKQQRQLIIVLMPKN
jgi:hypothetical protein